MLFISHLLEHDRYFSFFGIAVILTVAFLFSSNRKKIRLRLILTSLTMQFSLAYFILKTATGRYGFQQIAAGFTQLYEFASEGTRFILGNLADPTGAWGYVFVIKVVPIIVFFGAFMSLLYHLGIIQLLVYVISRIISPLLGASGAETLCAVANSMLGQTEAPLLIRKYLPQMTTSEILVVMVSGMGTISGALLAVYGSIGVPMVHLLSASVMAVPGSILISKMLIPETETPVTLGARKFEMNRDTENVLDAISSGTIDGLHLAANVVAMLISFISLIALINWLLGAMHFYTLNQIFGALFAPVARLIGIPAADSTTAGMLLGTKLVVNEFVAFTEYMQADLLPRSQVILTYALCGFSNFSCIGIQIGGIGALAPNKRALLTRLGYTALLGGTLTNMLNAAIASLLI